MLFSLFAATLASLLAAPPVAPAGTAVFPTETTLVLAPFHVVKKQRYVDDVTRDDVVLLEDGVPRSFTFFEGGRVSRRRTVPVEMGLLFDTSRSTSGHGLLQPLTYQSSLLEGLEDVQLSIYGFDSHLRRHCRPTRDFDLLTASLESVQGRPRGPNPDRVDFSQAGKHEPETGSESRLYESILAMARDMAAGPSYATRMILVFSDGSTTSGMTAKDVARPLRELGIPVYPVILGQKELLARVADSDRRALNRCGRLQPLSESARSLLDGTGEEDWLMRDFASLGEMTGGRSFSPPTVSLSIARAILESMVGAIRCEFIAGFVPDVPGGRPTKHRLEVKLRSGSIGKVTRGTRTLAY